MTDAAHRLAMVAAAKEDLGRCRVALEALAVTFDKLLEPIAAGPLMPPYALEGLPGNTYPGGPAMRLARALIAYLEAGGRLEPDIALDLAGALTVSRSRRRLAPGGASSEHS